MTTEKELARRLYESVRNLPIYDYHNHLDPDWLRHDHIFSDPAELWLASDPYKHRLMRICGVPEEKITGDASPREKFDAWCEIFPRLVGTPVYEWSLMELELLGIPEKPSGKTAGIIWEKMSRELSFSALYKKFNIAKMSPVASITDDIGWYKNRPDASPSMRGDSLLSPDSDLISKISSLTGMKIVTLDDYLAAVGILLGRFADTGCRFADHAIDDRFEYVEDENAAKFFGMPTEDQDDYHRAALASLILTRLGNLYEERGFTLLLHLGAMRKTSTRLREKAGAAGGYAGIGTTDFSSIVKLLNSMEQSGGLPKTILFPLDPSQFEKAAVLSGSFSKDRTEAIISEGAAWWWCDHRNGIERMLDSVAAYSVLDTFVGMTTDSRNILSFVRHDYFRKVVCAWFAKKLTSGEFSADEEDILPILGNICHDNAAKLFR